MSRDAPSVSAILLCYDSERFVRDAIESVLAQDYAGPMEILVSDDASTDGTVEVVSEVLSGYAGPRPVRLLRNDVNAGSKSAHLNRILPAASGEILVSFDDDDVSHSDRVRKIVDAFAPRRVHAVYSAYSLIDEHGIARGPGSAPRPGPDTSACAWFARVDAYAPGMTLAVRRRVIERFGALAPDVHEDVVLPFRASLLGEVAFLPEALVKARRRATSLTTDLDRFRSIERYRERMLRGIEQARRNLETRLADLAAAEAFDASRAPELAGLRAIANRSFALAESTARLVSPSLRERAVALLDLIRAGAYREERAQHSFLALMPRTYLRYKRHSLGVNAAPSRAGSR
jgi:glycosyltransferase involved in cell wall biosynthesis